MNEIDIQMTKRRSPHRITIKTDPADPHFCNVELRKIKTGEVKAQHYILAKDLLTWISFLESDGFRVSKQLVKN